MRKERNLQGWVTDGENFSIPQKSRQGGGFQERDATKVAFWSIK